MGEPVKATDWPPRHEDREEEEITMPIETIPVQGGARNPRTHSGHEERRIGAAHPGLEGDRRAGLTGPPRAGCPSLTP